MKPLLSLLLVTLLLPAARTRAEEPNAAMEKLGWKLAIHSYTFSKLSIHEAIDRTADLGVKYMSISGSVNLGEGSAFKRSSTLTISEKDAADLEAQMKAKGIHWPFVNMGVVHPTVNEAESRKIFETAKRLGIDTLVAEPETHNKMEELPAVMDVVEKLAKEYNIKIAIHNHPGPKNFYWNPDTILAAVKGRSPLLGSCADVGHWVRSGLDPVECLRKLEGRIITLHFKDESNATPKAKDVAWGKGVANLRGMMEELKRQHFQGFFCVEYESDWGSSTADLVDSLKFFHDVCDELVKS